MGDTCYIRSVTPNPLFARKSIAANYQEKYFPTLTQLSSTRTPNLFRGKEMSRRSPAPRGSAPGKEIAVKFSVVLPGRRDTDGNPAPRSSQLAPGRTTGMGIWGALEERPSAPKGL